MRKFLTAATLAAALATGAAAPAQALTINLMDQGGVISSDVRRGYEAAAHYWESVIATDATINIGMTFDPDNVSTHAIAASQRIDVRSWESRVLATRSSSALDQSLVLPEITRGGVTFITDSTPGNAGYYDGSSGSEVARRELMLNTALFKALGDTRLAPDSIDGTIYMGGPNFDFDPRDGVASNKVDFLVIALHEVGHILGFVSGVDTVGRIGVSDAVRSPTFSALDMFRYNRDHLLQAPGDGPVLDFSFGQPYDVFNAYFSIDGGATALFGNRFSSGWPYQASHWASAPCGLELGLMDPTYCDGDLSRQVSALDLAAFDAMGWNLRIDALANPDYRMSTSSVFAQYMASLPSAVPEPSTWAMLILGFGVLGARLRRDRLVARPAI